MAEVVRVYEATDVISEINGVLATIRDDLGVLERRIRRNDGVEKVDLDMLRQARTEASRVGYAVERLLSRTAHIA